MAHRLWLWSFLALIIDPSKPTFLRPDGSKTRLGVWSRCLGSYSTQTLDAVRPFRRLFAGRRLLATSFRVHKAWMVGVARSKRLNQEGPPITDQLVDFNRLYGTGKRKHLRYVIAFTSNPRPRPNVQSERPTTGTTYHPMKNSVAGERGRQVGQVYISRLPNQVAY